MIKFHDTLATSAFEAINDTNSSVGRSLSLKLLSNNLYKIIKIKDESQL